MSGEAKAETAVCRWCGRPIEFEDPFWRHVGESVTPALEYQCDALDEVYRSVEPSPVAPGEPERPEPQGEIPRYSLGLNGRMWPREDGEFIYHALHEAALTSCREERDLKQCAIDTLGISLKHATEERDKARDALRKHGRHTSDCNCHDGLECICGFEVWEDFFAKPRRRGRSKAALKPVSDRQPEGEKP